MATPAAAVKHYKLSQRLQALAVVRARKAWAAVQVGLLTESWEIILRNSKLEAAVTGLQVDAATSGAAYGAMALAAQGLYDAPQAFVNPSAFGGFAADGRSLNGLLYAAVPHTKRLIAGGMAPSLAKVSGGSFLETVVKTTIADAGRGAAGVDTFARPNTGYVRMLNTPSCARCTVLAGKFYKHNAGFLRHPGCDCVHVQSMEKALNGAASEGLLSDPYEYFNGLSESEQDRAFTRAGAQAIRDGGDVFQVINSRRGMKPGGLVTTEGTTKRGAYGRGKAPRLTPEGIYSQNLARAESLKLLEKNGYILPGGQDPQGVIVGQREGFGQDGRGGRNRGASQAVRDARASGVRDPNQRATMTAAERRLNTARLDWDAVRAGRNPHGRAPLTPQIAATAEGNFRRWLASNGEIFTE